ARSWICTNMVSGNLMLSRYRRSRRPSSHHACCYVSTTLSLDCRVRGPSKVEPRLSNRRWLRVTCSQSN
ncbi:hypothetical protein BGZ65_005019, partial [Modicella reniformis]